MTDQQHPPHNVNPMTHDEPVKYPAGRDPVLDSPHNKEAAVDDFKRVLVLSLILAAVFMGASFIITR